MNTIYYKDLTFFYINEASAEIVLNCKNFLSNKSRVSMHSHEDDVITIPKLLINQNNMHHKLFQNTLLEKADTVYLLTNLLITRYAISSPLPKNALAIGCENGALAFHMASVLGTFHPESTIHFVCNQIVNNGNNSVLEVLTQIDNLPNCSLSVGDYHNTMLQEQHFDIVVIDDLFALSEPLSVIHEAERLIKPHGLLILITKNPELNNYLAPRYSTLKHYSFNDAFVFAVSDICVPVDKKVSFSEVAQSYISTLQQTFNENISKQQLQKIITELESYIANAIQNNEISWKIYLINLKEAFLTYLLQTKQEFKDIIINEILFSLSHSPE